MTDFGIESEDTPFLVMEYIEGISLDDFLRKEKRLTPEKAFEIMEPIALGVAAAHGNGITHRDLKPLNVMLKKDHPLAQAVKVLDFGLAKMKASESVSSLIMAKTNNLLGSPHYMPPEQWDNEGVDSRTDIYSLGIILFQMLTGDVPFKGNSIPNVMYQHLQAPTPSFVSLGFPASPEIESVLQKALEKEQHNRFATVEEFLSAYKKALPKTSDVVTADINDKTFGVSDEIFPPPVTTSIKIPKNSTAEDFGNTFNLPYLNADQNETLSNFLNQPKTLEVKGSERLEQDFFEAQNRVEEARSKISQAEKLAIEFNEAQREAENARYKVLEAQQKLEEDLRHRLQAEMEGKLAVEREAREKAEAEADRLMEEVEARKKTEERANELAKTALEAQQKAEKAHQKAEKEVRQRELEEGSRRKAEEIALRLAGEVAEEKRKYEEAKKEAEYEAYYRMEAELKRKKVEEEIERLAEFEAERRKIAEAEAARQIKEQASRLERQSLVAQQKADEARRLAESETKKREQAEAARVKAENEARRLAEEIIEAQKRLEKAEQRAESESEKRALEEAARKKAEDEARSTSLENRQNVEIIKKNLLSQIEAAQQLAKSESEKRDLEAAAQKRAEESALFLPVQTGNDATRSDPFKNSSPVLTAETQPGFDVLSSGQKLADTSPTNISKTNRIPAHKSFNALHLAAGLFAFLLVGGVGGFLIYKQFAPDVSTAGNTSGNTQITNSPAQTPSPTQLPERIKNKMVFIKGGVFQMGRNDVLPKGANIYDSQYPAHPVTVEDFYLDKTEVTNEEYAEFVKAKGYKSPDNWQKGNPPAGRERFPVTNVSYFDVTNFAAWMSSRDKVLCRLPTEEEWEYAARSGSQQFIYPWGGEWNPARVNFATGAVREAGSTGDETAVGNIQDMMGNVLEWTFSKFEYYPAFPENKKENSAGKVTVRGVSFTKEKAETLQKTELLLTLRQAVSPDKKFDFLGFRLMCNSK